MLLVGCMESEISQLLVCTIGFVAGDLSGGGSSIAAVSHGQVTEMP